MTELELLLKISKLKDDTHLCHTQDPEYKHLIKLCRALKEKGFITFKKPSSGIYTPSSRDLYPVKHGFLTTRLTYEGQMEVIHIRNEKRKFYISLVSLCISLSVLLVPLLCKYFPALSKYIQSLLGR